jgi:hypothetical protein
MHHPATVVTMALFLLPALSIPAMAGPPSVDDIRLTQPILPGMPLLYWQGDGVVVSAGPGADELEIDDLFERLERLHAIPSFEASWGRFVAEVTQTARAMHVSPETAARFNLEVLPSILLGHPELVEAFLIGDMGLEVDEDPPSLHGPVICLERRYGEELAECCLSIFKMCLVYCKAKCYLDRPGTTCYQDVEIPCPGGDKTSVDMEFD